MCDLFQERPCSRDSGKNSPECRIVNEGLCEKFKQIGWADTERESEREKVHARLEGGRGGWDGRKARKYLERRRILSAAKGETAVLLSDAAVGDSCLAWKQRCGFTHYFSCSSSFLVLVSLTDINLEPLWHPRGDCVERLRTGNT